MKILITGRASLIGYSLTKKLRKKELGEKSEKNFMPMQDVDELVSL